MVALKKIEFFATPFHVMDYAYCLHIEQYGVRGGTAHPEEFSDLSSCDLFTLLDQVLP